MDVIDGLIVIFALVVAITAIVVVRNKRSAAARSGALHFSIGLLLTAATGLVICGVILAATNAR